MTLIFRNISFSLLTAIFCMFFISFTGFIFHCPINVIYPVLSFALGLITLILLTLKQGRKNIIISILLYFFVIFLSLIFGFNFYDGSWDGRAYHQASILFLGNGWNPIYDNIDKFASDFFNNTNVFNTIWVENYPKFAEIVQADIYTVFKNIEITKMTNILMAVILFGYSYYVLNKRFFKGTDKPVKLLISCLIVLNPVFIAQFMTFYVDSYVYMLFMLILFSVIDIETGQKQKYISYSVLAVSSICIANVKLGGLLYLIVTLSLYFAYLLIFRRKNAKGLVFSISLIIFFIFLSGINPYFTNINQHRHPLHPLAGSNKEDVMTRMTPKDFSGNFYLKNFLLSSFSCTDNFTYTSDRHIQLKLPFVIYKKELKNLTHYDTRISGFGVLWSGIIILSLLLSVKIRYRNKLEKSLFLLIFSILFMLILSNPYSWWARYSPHIWAIPLFVYLASKNKKENGKNLISALLLITITANILIQFPYSVCAEQAYHKKTDLQIADLKEYNKKIKIYSVLDYGFIEHLKQNSINFEFVDKEYYNENKQDFFIIPNLLTEDMYWDKPGR